MTGLQGRTRALATYGRVANAETDPLQQVVMLYDGAIKFIRIAASDIAAQDLAAKAEHTNRALDIISYLQSILDFPNGGAAAPALDALYGQTLALVLRASASLDAALMSRAADLLAPVRDAWATNAQAANTRGAALAPAQLAADNSSTPLRASA